MNTSMKKRLFSALRSRNEKKAMKLINSIDLSHARDWSEGHDLLRVALEHKQRAVAKLLILNGFKVNSNYDCSITPLHYVAIYGDVEIVEMLLDRNAQIDAKDSYGQTPLHHAIKNNKIKVVELLINRRACVNASDRDGITPLHIASNKIRPEIVEILLNSDAYVNPTIHATPTPNVREGYTPLHYAVERNSQKITELLLKYNADVNIMAGCRTPLYIDVETRELKILLNFLKERASVNSECTSMGYTPLHLACMKGSTEVVRLLLMKGANINAVAKGNFSPLYIATKAAHKTTVKLLLEHGAEVDVLNEDGNTALCYAIERGYSDIIEEIFKFCPDFYNKSNESSLSHAIKSPEIKYKKIVDNFLKNGFRVSPKYINDSVLLHSAVKHGYLTIVDDLLRHGADVNMRLRTTPYECRTLLHTATICLQEEVAELLVNCGAYVDARDIYQKTPIFYAIQHLHLKITKLLLANGANVETEDYIYLLNTAVDKGSIEIIEILSQCNIDVDVYGRDKLKTTTWQSQVQKDFWRRIDQQHLDLTRNGIKPFIESFNKYTIPLDRSADRICLMANHYLVPARNGIKPFIASFDEDITPLHISTNKGCVITTQMLLNIGVSVNAKICDGTTALHIAVAKGYTKVVKMLLENGASANAKTYDCQTPLHLATLKGHQEIAKYLIQFGAEVDLIDMDGKTALFYAGLIQNKFLIKLLLQNGSDINIKCPFGFDYIDCIDYIAITGSSCTDYIDIKYSSDKYNHIDMEIAKMFVRQVAKLKSKNLFVNETYLQMIRSATVLRQHYYDCKKEITEMKNRKISNTRLSFYDIFLTNDIHQLEAYARNESIIETFESAEYIKMFPIHANELENQLKKGQETLNLLNSSFRHLNSSFGLELLDPLMYKVLSYLNNWDFKYLIYACPSDICDES